MTETEWILRRELAQTKMQLYQAQVAVLQQMFDKAQSELSALGDKWEQPVSNEPAS